MLVTAWSWWQTFETVTSICVKIKDVLSNFNLSGCAPGHTLQPRQTARGEWGKFLRAILSKPLLYSVVPAQHHEMVKIYLMATSSAGEKDSLLEVS